jgi:RNA polymerase sigma-70 factor (ECF subfamily)
MADLSRYAATLVRDHSLIQDGIQEVFLRYFIARVDGQQMNNPRAWLFRVLRNYLLDCNRKTAVTAAICLKEATHVADSRQDVETGYQHAESCSRALTLLSPREQECMRLRLEGFSYSEIAHILRIQPGTVASLISRSLKRLRQNRKTLDK